MSPEGWFRVEEFAPGTFQLTEGGRWKMFLLIGDEKALLLDSGVGFGDLRALCESLTDLPIDHVLTHTHWDHIGSSHRWDAVGVHPQRKRRAGEGPLQKVRRGHPGLGGRAALPARVRARELHNSARHLRLGGQRGRHHRSRRAHPPRLRHPRHSPCSITLLDDREGVLITGDLVKPLQPLNLRVPTAVLSEYGPSLRKLEKVAAENEVKWVCSGHTDAFPDSSIIGEMARFMEEIEAGKHDPPRKMTHPNAGQIDVYQATRFSVWITDTARR
jgi:glyoxylase-like metal-dependent hydrolase (beta-lactamase superfamily II)